MISPAVVALVLRARTPWLDDRRVRVLSAAIVATVDDRVDVVPMWDDEGRVRAGFEYDDERRELDEAAALIVIGERESAWRVSVGSCAIPGLGGWGYFGVAGLWAGRFPGGTCGTAQLQARAALAILRIGRVPDSDMEGATDWSWTFGHFIGARSVGRHPEARARARQWREVREMLTLARLLA